MNCFYNTRHVFRETICNCRANCAFALLSQMFPRMKQSVVADKCSRCHAKSAQMMCMKTEESTKILESSNGSSWKILESSNGSSWQTIYVLLSNGTIAKNILLFVKSSSKYLIHRLGSWDGVSIWQTDRWYIILSKLL